MILSSEERAILATQTSKISRGEFRTQSNIYDGAFLQRNLTGF